MEHFSFWQKISGVPFYKRHSATYLYLFLGLSYPVSGIFHFSGEYNFGDIEPYSGLLFIGLCILTGTIKMCFFSSTFTFVGRFDNFIKIHEITEDEENLDTDEWGGFSLPRGCVALFALGVSGFIVLFFSGILGHALRGAYAFLAG